MTVAEERELVRVLSYFNPWWETGKILDVEPFKRLDFTALQVNMDGREIITIVGARQVGKTTLIEQCIEYLLQYENPRHILLIRGDNSELHTISNDPIRDSLQIYQNYILKEDLNKITHRAYVIVDEVQRIENWANVLKSWYDINKNMKFIVSGSSSTKVISDSVKPFVGRVKNQILVPFKFLETVRFYYHAKRDKENQISINKERRILRDAFIKILEKKKVGKKAISEFYSILNGKYTELVPKESTIKKLLDDFLVKGGYPAVVKTENLRSCVETLATNYRDVINTDIKNIYNIRKPLLMEKLLVLLSKQTSKTINIAEIANDLAEPVKTITEYISYLDDTFIISLAENYRYSRSTNVKKRIKKIYVHDVGLRNTINNTMDYSVLLDGGELGKLVETVVFNHCLRLKFKVSPQYKPDLFYWNINGYEVDIVFEHKDRALPIEVKYRNNVDKNDLKSLEIFMERYNSPYGLLITKDKLEVRNKIILIPLWIFLILC